MAVKQRKRKITTEEIYYSKRQVDVLMRTKTAHSAAQHHTADLSVSPNGIQRGDLQNTMPQL